MEKVRKLAKRKFCGRKIPSTTPDDLPVGESVRENLDRLDAHVQQICTVVMNLSARFDPLPGKIRAAHRPVMSTPVNGVVGAVDDVMAGTRFSTGYNSMLTPLFLPRRSHGRRRSGRPLCKEKLL